MTVFLILLAVLVVAGGGLYWRKAQRARQIDRMDAQRVALAQLRGGSARRPDDP